MIRNSFTVNLRNQLSTIAMDMDSRTFVESMSAKERSDLQGKIGKVIEFVDKKIK